VWQAEGLLLRISSFAAYISDRPVLFICYRIENKNCCHKTAVLFAAVRPFQVTPTWQNWRSFGGAVQISELAFRDSAVWVNGSKALLPLTTPGGFGAAAFAQGPVTDYLAGGELPPAACIQDAFGYASGALRFAVDLDPGAAQEIYMAVPFGSGDAGEPFLSSLKAASGPRCMEQALTAWKQRLGTVDFFLPEHASAAAETFKTAAAHILINRDGPALHPGPRRYARSWIRDGVIMGAAYARFQDGDGNLPDCADQDGTEWLPEFDAYGQFVFGIMEYYRFTGDTAFLEEMRPAAAKALSYMEGLRSRRLTAEFQTPEKKAAYGLLPESMSHEGYMAHPVHAYWDDFWALRGFTDGAALAAALGDSSEAERLRAESISFAEHIRASLAASIARHSIDFVPGSVEFGDFDPTATAIAAGLLDQLQLLPRAATEKSYDKYREGFRRRMEGNVDWNNYTAYEVRIVGALVRLGRREEAVELLEFLLKDQRMPAWRQWPEITWRDPGGPGFMGDLPHTWISAEYMLSLCSMFAYEREEDASLVIAGGVAASWLAGGAGVGVNNLPTRYGRLSFSLRLVSVGQLHLAIDGDIDVPPGGIVVKPPLERPIRRVEVNGRVLADFAIDSFTVHACPADAAVTF